MPCVSEMLIHTLLAVQCGFLQQAESDLAKWVQQQRVAAEAGIHHEYLRVSWQDERVYIPSPNQLRAMRQSVANRPDHPERDELERFERRLKQGPDVEEYDVWLGPKGSFRRNFTGADGKYEDLVVSDRQSWSYAESGRHLNLIASKGAAPPGYNYGPWDHRLRGTLAGFVYGAFSIQIPGVSLELSELVQTGLRWRAVFASEEPLLSLALEGTWDDSERWGTADMATVIVCEPAPGEVGRRWVFEDWTSDSIFSPQMCRKQTSYAPDGRPDLVQTFGSIERISRRDFDKVAMPPDPASQSDRVRGAVVVSTAHRISGDSEPSVVVVYDATGQQLAEISERDFDANRRRRLLQTGAAVGIPGVIIVVIGGALWRRARILQT